jgi:hypothetical protein
MDPVETWEHAGVSVKLFSDADAASPRDCDGKIGEMFVSYPGYALGDTQLPREGLSDVDCPQCKGSGLKPSIQARAAEPPPCQRCEGMGTVAPTVQEWLASEKAIAAVPLFVYEHSGITMRTGKLIWLADEEVERSDTESRGRFSGDAQGWDTSFVGFVVVRDAHIAEAMGLGWEKHRTPEWIAKAVDAEVEEYARYLEGDVYGYVVAEDTPFHDSCWGFIGFKYAQEQANEAAKDAAGQIAGEVREQAARG